MPNTAPGLPYAQSFVTAHAGTVSDKVTGLMWQQTIDPQQLSFARANEHCAQLSLSGYEDWRLPSRLELVSILDTSRTEPAIDLTAFPGTPSDWFWTSTVAAGDEKSAWCVYFYFGYPKTELASNQFSVRCVRTVEPGPAPLAKHYDVLAETVYDLGTSLTWQRAVPAERLTFDAAQAYCAGLILAGKSGWRVPSLQELLTLIDQSVADAPMIDGVAFPDTAPEPFWSSSYFGNSTSQSWQVYFDRGNGLYGLPSATFRVRCVTASP